MSKNWREAIFRSGFGVRLPRLPYLRSTAGSSPWSAPALDLWFVLGLGWGVTGVAQATIIAEWTGLALGLALCAGAFSGSQWRDWPRVFNPARLRHMAVVNTDIMIRSVALHAMFMMFIFRGSSFGDATLAANHILLQFLEITAYALDGFAFAAEALVGQAMGARRRAALRQAVLITSFWGLLAVIAMSVAFAAFGPMLIDAHPRHAPRLAGSLGHLHHRMVDLKPLDR